MNYHPQKTFSYKYIPIYFLYIGQLLIQLATPLDISSVMSIGTWIIVLASVLAVAISFAYGEIQIQDIISLILFIITSLFSLFLAEKTGYQVFTKLLCFFEIPFFLISYDTVSKKSKNFIYFVFFIESVYYIALSYSPLANVIHAEYGDVYMDYYTLGYSNANETAVYLFPCVIVLLSLFYDVKSKFLKLLILVDTILIARLLFLTDSRTAMIILIIFAVLILFYGKRKVPAFFVKPAFAAPIIFVFILTYFHERISNMSLWGDDFDTGRYDIYTNVIEKMNIGKFLFGDIELNFQNLHNGFFTVFATVGIIGCSIFIYLLYKKISCLFFETKNSIALLGLLCLVISVSTEAALITAGSSYAGAFLSAYFLCLSNEKECETNENITDKHSLS